jgi:cyclic peptide transporter
MKLLQFLLRFSRTTVVFAIVFGIISGASSAGLLAWITTALSTHRPSTNRLVWIFIGLCVLMLVSRYLSDFLLCRLGHDATFDLRIRLSRKILATSLRQLEEIGAPRLLAALTTDVATITNALLFIPLLCINAAKVIGCLVFIGWLSGYVLVLVLGFIVVGAISYRLPIIKGSRLQKLARDETDALYNHFRALTEGTKELKLHRQRRHVFFNEVLSRTADALRRHNIKAMAYFIAGVGWGQALFFIFTGVLILWFPTISAISMEVIAASVITVLYMVTPLDSIMNTLASLSNANIALGKLAALGLSLSAQETEHSQVANLSPSLRHEVLELVDVKHIYHHERDNSDFVLGPINLSFFAGEMVFLIGGNGSGKTTLLKLLAGLYTPGSGEIRFAGQTLTDETLESYRRNFSVVFSDSFLFESLLGIEAQDLDSRAHEYLARLQLEHKVEIKQGVFSTVALSQGQRKRLALLVAYLEDRPIYIFDEWAADQDPYFKDVFYLDLLPELKARGKTVIVISHDDRYYYLADRLIKIDSGQVEYDKFLLDTSNMLAEIRAN